MARIILLIAIVLVSNLSTERVVAQYYYGGGKRIPLKIDSTRITVQFATTLTNSERSSIVAEIGRKSDTVSDHRSVDDFRAYTLSTTASYLGFFYSLQQIDGISMVEVYYTNESGVPFPTGNTFCVAFDRALPVSVIDSINRSYNVIIVRELRGMPNVFILRNTDSSGYRLLDIANAYYLMDETRYSNPVFLPIASQKIANTQLLTIYSQWCNLVC